MSFHLVDPHLDLAALEGVRVEKHATGQRRLYCPIATYNALPASSRQRIHATVVEIGIEAWCEDGDVVFHVARLPLHRGARRAHAKRVAFLLGTAPE